MVIIRRGLNCGRRLGGDERKEAVAAIDMFKGMLRSLRKWCIGCSYLKGWGGVC